MLVDVVQLRHKGARLSREESRAVVPVRGLLSLNPGRPGHFAGKKDPPLLAGLIAEGGHSWLIQPLDQARVAKIVSGSMLITGIEEEDLGRARVLHYRQAWWVRPVTGPRVEPPTRQSSLPEAAAPGMRRAAPSNA